MGSVNSCQLAPSCQNIDDIRGHQQSHTIYNSTIVVWSPTRGEPQGSSIRTSSYNNRQYEPWPQATVYIPKMNPEKNSHVSLWTATHFTGCAVLTYSMGVCVCLNMIHLKWCIPHNCHSNGKHDYYQPLDFGGLPINITTPRTARASDMQKRWFGIGLEKDLHCSRLVLTADAPIPELHRHWW